MQTNRLDNTHFTGSRFIIKKRLFVLCYRIFHYKLDTSWNTYIHNFLNNNFFILILYRKQIENSVCLSFKQNFIYWHLDKPNRISCILLFIIVVVVGDRKEAISVLPRSVLQWCPDSPPHSPDKCPDSPCYCPPHSPDKRCTTIPVRDRARPARLSRSFLTDSGCVRVRAIRNSPSPDRRNIQTNLWRTLAPIISTNNPLPDNISPDNIPPDNIRQFNIHPYNIHPVNIHPDNIHPVKLLRRWSILLLSMPQWNVPGT